MMKKFTEPAQADEMSLNKQFGLKDCIETIDVSLVVLVFIINSFYRFFV